MKIYRRIATLLSEINNSKSASEIEMKKDELNRLMDKASYTPTDLTNNDLDNDIILYVYTNSKMNMRPLPIKIK